MRTAPFDLEKALAGHPLVTKDGLRVKEFSVSPDVDFPFSATYENRDTSSYTHKGTYFIDEISQKDLLLLLSDEPEEPVTDQQRHNGDYTMDYYNTGKIEVMDFIEDQQLGYSLGNVIKYVARAGKKDPNKTIEDLKKAQWYLNRYIANLEQSK